MSRQSQRGRQHVALYGNVANPRAWCSDCGVQAFVIDGTRQCCDRPVVMVPKAIKRESEPEFARRRPTKAERAEILDQQGQRCAYCERMFGSVIERRGRLVALRVEWDHEQPWIYTQNNRLANFVAACHVCNGLKGSKMFGSLDEARVYLQLRWTQKELVGAPGSTPDLDAPPCGSAA